MLGQLVQHGRRLALAPDRRRRRLTSSEMLTPPSRASWIAALTAARLQAESAGVMPVRCSQRAVAIASPAAATSLAASREAAEPRRRYTTSPCGKLRRSRASAPVGAAGWPSASGCRRPRRADRCGSFGRGRQRLRAPRRRRNDRAARGRSRRWPRLRRNERREAPGGRERLPLVGDERDERLAQGDDVEAHPSARTSASP